MFGYSRGGRKNTNQTACCLNSTIKKAINWYAILVVDSSSKLHQFETLGSNDRRTLQFVAYFCNSVWWYETER